MRNKQYDIEIIKVIIEEKRNAISNLQTQIRELQDQWIALLPIKIGDDIKVTRSHRDYRGETTVTESSGRVTSIKPSHYYEDTMEYTVLPFKKDGTVAKIGVFTCRSNEDIEKLNQ